MNTVTLLTKITLAGLAGVSTCGLIHASVLAVNFGADYTSSNINTAAVSAVLATLDANFDGNATDRVASVSLGTIFTAPNSANWTTPVDKSGGVIKYGVSVANINSASDPAVNLNRISSADIIQVTNAAGTAQMRMASAYYWEKSSFLNGFDAVAGLSLHPSVNITATFNNTGTPTNEGGRLSRVLLESAGVWYVSANVFGGTNGTITFDGLTSDWYLYNPVSGTLFWDTANPGAAISGSQLTDITAIGVYTQHALFNGSAINSALQGFSALEVAVVPEPATYALVFGLGVLMLVIRRRLR